MSVPPPPPQFGESLVNWWQNRRRSTKIVIGVGAVLVLMFLLGSISRVGSSATSTTPISIPTATRTNPEQTQSAYDLEMYRVEARLACRYARTTNFDHELAQDLLKYDYGTVNSSGPRAFLEVHKKNLAQACTRYR